MNKYQTKQLKKLDCLSIGDTPIRKIISLTGTNLYRSNTSGFVFFSPCFIQLWPCIILADVILVNIAFWGSYGYLESADKIYIIYKVHLCKINRKIYRLIIESEKEHSLLFFCSLTIVTLKRLRIAVVCSFTSLHQFMKHLFWADNACTSKTGILIITNPDQLPSGNRRLNCPGFD